MVVISAKPMAGRKLKYWLLRLSSSTAHFSHDQKAVWHVVAGSACCERRRIRQFQNTSVKEPVDVVKMQFNSDNMSRGEVGDEVVLVFARATVLSLNSTAHRSAQAELPPPKNAASHAKPEDWRIRPALALALATHSIVALFVPGDLHTICIHGE